MNDKTTVAPSGDLTAPAIAPAASVAADPTATATAPAAAPASSSKWTSANVISLAAVVACVGALAWMFMPAQTGPSYPPMVVIDTQSIVESRIAAMQKTDVDAMTLTRDSEEFAKRLREIVTGYAKHSVVANRAFVMAWPEGADITADVAKQLDVDLTLKMMRNPNGGIPENFNPFKNK